MNDIPKQETSNRRFRSVATVLLALFILIPSLYGFGSKLREFVLLTDAGSDGIFAMTPVVNYLLASAGFFFMLLWAMINGMFRDIEQPKNDLLATERLLDQNSTRT